MAETKQGTYEAMFLFGAAAASDLDASIQLCRELIERNGGQIIVLKKWDERKLAYEIKGNKRGVYIIAYYRGPGASVAAIDREVNLGETILRVLITRAEHLTEQQMHEVEPQPIVVREQRDNYGDRSDHGDRYEDRPRSSRGRRSESDEEEKR